MCAAQESLLFFTALDKVAEYGRATKHLPVLFVENVPGILFRRRDQVLPRLLGCRKGWCLARHTCSHEAYQLFSAVNT